MKTFLIPLLYLGILLPVLAQTPDDQDAAYQNQIKASKLIAERLFPDSAFPDSQLAKKMDELDATLKQNQSVLYYYSGKSLILSFEAAGILKYKVHWENVSGQQTSMVISELTYALICTKDFKKGGPAPTTGPGGALGTPGGITSIPLGIQALQPAPSSNSHAPAEKDGTINK